LCIAIGEVVHFARGPSNFHFLLTLILNYLRQGGYVFTLFVCLLAELRQKTTLPLFTKIGRNVAHGPQKKRLDFGGNPDHVTLGCWVKVMVGYNTWCQHYNPHAGSSHTLNSEKFARSAALAEALCIFILVFAVICFSIDGLRVLCQSVRSSVL